MTSLADISKKSGYRGFVPSEISQAKHMRGVREHEFKSPVWLDVINGREVVSAHIEVRYAACGIDLIDLVDWLRRNRPELLEGSTAAADKDQQPAQERADQVG